MKHVITVIAVLAVLLQGGFTDAVWSICGAARLSGKNFNFRSREQD